MMIFIMTRKILGMVMYDFVLVMDDIDLVKNGVILVMNDGLIHY